MYSHVCRDSRRQRCLKSQRSLCYLAQKDDIESLERAVEEARTLGGEIDQEVLDKAQEKLRRLRWQRTWSGA